MALSCYPQLSPAKWSPTIATSFAGGTAYRSSVAKAKSGATFDEAIYTTKAGFDVAAAQGGLSAGKGGRGEGAGWLH
jgi:hypothetical protein